MNHEERAIQNFMNGCNCAQAVFLAFAPELGISDDLALRLSSSFGGGMGRLREVCGAVSGVLMAAGGLYGYADLSDAAAKADHYALVQALAGQFREQFGSIICRELLDRKGAEPPVPDARTPDYYAKRPCARFVGGAARILEQYMVQHTPNPLP